MKYPQDPILDFLHSIQSRAQDAINKYEDSDKEKIREDKNIESFLKAADDATDEVATYLEENF